MSDSDEYEKIDESCINSVAESDKESNISDAIESPDTPMTEMEEFSMNDQMEEENGGVEGGNEDGVVENEQSENDDDYIYYTDEELYESQAFQPVSTSSIAHEKAVQITRRKMKKLKITTPDIICIQGRDADIDAKDDSQSKLDELKNIRQNLIQNFAEKKKLGILAYLVHINDRIIQMQGYDDIEDLKPEPKPCSSKTLIHEDLAKIFIGEVTVILDEMIGMKDEEEDDQFNEAHQEFLEIFLKIGGIENPLIEKEKMKHYSKLLQPFVGRFDHERLSRCPFGKYMNDGMPEKLVQKCTSSSSRSMAQTDMPTSLAPTIQASQIEAPKDPKLQAALAAFKAASEEYTSLLGEKHKAFAEDPKDIQQHEHMRKLCLEAEKQFEKAREEYQKLAASTPKLSVVKGPTCDIRPKSANLFHLNRGIDTIKLAEAEEEKKNFPGAISLYSTAVDDFLQAIKEELTEPKAKENVQRRIQKYVVKYEKLKEYLLTHTNEVVNYLVNPECPRGYANFGDPCPSQPPSSTSSDALQASIKIKKPLFFNQIKQFDLYTLLSSKMLNPSTAQHEFFEALKNNKFGNEKLVLHDLKLLEHANVASTNLLMREACSSCAILLAEKAPAVLAYPENKILQIDLIKSCSEEYQKYKDTVENYKEAVKAAIIEDDEIASWTSWTKSYSRPPLEDISKEYKCEEMPKKFGALSDKIRHEEIRQKLLKQKVVTEKLTEKIAKEMTLGECGIEVSSKSYSTPEHELNPLKILEEFNLARDKKLADDLPEYAASLNLDEKVAKSYRALKYEEKTAESIKSIIGKFTEQDIVEIGIQYLDMYDKALAKMSKATEAFKKCFEESKGLSPGAMPYMEFYKEKARLDQLQYTKKPVEDPRSQLMKKITEQATENRTNGIIKQLQALRQQTKATQYAAIDEKRSQKVSYSQLMKAYNMMLVLQEEVLKVNIQADDISDLKKLEYFQKISEIAEKARKDYMILYEAYSTAPTNEIPRRSSKSKIEVLQDRIKELKEMVQSCKNSPSAASERILAALIAMLNEEQSMRKWELAITEDKNGKILRTLYQKNFEESQFLLKCKTKDFERLRDVGNTVEAEKCDPELCKKAQFHQYPPEPGSKRAAPSPQYSTFVKSELRKYGVANPEAGITVDSIKSKVQPLIITRSTTAEDYEKYLRSMEESSNVEMDTSQGDPKFQCLKCHTNLSTKDVLVSSNFKDIQNGAPAYLFSGVANIKSGDICEKNLSGGKYFFREVSCNGCDEKLGWIYEFAFDQENKYKEGKFILAKNLITVGDDSQDFASSDILSSSQSHNIQNLLNSMAIDTALDEVDKIYQEADNASNMETDINVDKFIDNEKIEFSITPKDVEERRNMLIRARDDLRKQRNARANPNSTRPKSPPTSPTSLVEALEEELNEIKVTLKDTENSRKTLIELNEILKAQKEDFHAKYLSLQDHNDYLAKEHKKLFNTFTDREQKNMEEFEKVFKHKDATIARLQTELAQAKDELSKGPKKQVESTVDPNLSAELEKAQQQIKYYQKLASDQAAALKKFELAASLEKQLSKANDKVEKVEKALRKREALDSACNDLALKRFRDSSDDDEDGDQFPAL